jgi:hypothetical protein
MIIIDYGNEVAMIEGVYIDYGLVQAKINLTDILPLPYDPRDMYNLED